jgi:endonuclease/exonuclease/phosphatase family metal-dependent hydrolase
MTLNVRMVTAVDGVNRWPNRARLCARAIRDQAPDLIGFQEMQADHLELLDPVLGGYDRHLGLDASSPVKPEHQAVFWSSERFELLDAGGFYLSESPDRWSTGWDAACPRVATWVRLRVLEGGRELIFCNTHLDREGRRARLEGAALIMRRIARGPAEILVGDFNARPGSPPHRLLADQGFVDVYRGPEQGTFHGFQGETGRRGRRIDWILVRGAVAADSCQIVQDAEPPLYPSDHYPLVADLVLA